MATQARSVLQDQNMTLDFKGNGIKESTRVLRSKKNASLGGRKALADLSNSTKPCANNAKKKDNKPAIVRGEIGAHKRTSSVSGKTSAPESGNLSTFVGSRNDFSTKLSSVDGNLKVSKLLSPVRGKINVFVEPSDSEHSSMLQTKKQSQLRTEFVDSSPSQVISSGNESMPLTHQVSENSNFTTKLKEGGRKALVRKAGNGSGENIVQKMASFSKGFESSAHQSVDSHVYNAKEIVGRRKALADISNSSSTNVQQASRVSHCKNLKAIADEQFLHDHQECINMQKGAMDMNSILRILGLDDGHSQIQSSSTVLPDEVKEKIGTPLKKWEDLDLAELQVETPYRFTSPQLLDDCLSSPESVISPMHWNYDMSPKFTLVDTPLEKQCDSS